MQAESTMANSAHDSAPPTLRAGIIGLDTSHVIEFAKIFHAENPAEDVAGLRVVAAYPGGTDLPFSRDRIGEFTAQLREMGVEIVDTIPELLERVDVVLLESLDGRIHLEEARLVIAAGKPVFVDKPVAGSLAEAIMIFKLAARAGVPCFSSSSIRFGDVLLTARSNDELGPVVGCDTWGPCKYQAGLPDLFFYGIHGVEGLFAAMGTGCQTVSRTHTEDTDLVVGTWEGGRIGTYRGMRNTPWGIGITVFHMQGTRHTEIDDDEALRLEYENLCREIVRFFSTGAPPVPTGETLEIYAFMEAADASRSQGGAAVSVSDVFRRAKAEAATRLASK